jgi:hypothetical protein
MRSTPQWGWRRLAVFAVAAVWALIILGWPGLPTSLDPAAVGRESSVLLAAASIDGGLVVLTLTIGSVALQLLSQFSWRLNRTIIDGPLVTLISAAVAGGVVWPLWVASGPSPIWTRWAFTSFGWSVLLIACVAWLAAERIQPAWLVARACQRALRLVDRSDVVRPEAQAKLVDVGASLSELVASEWLPYAQFRMAVVSYVTVLAVRCRAAGALSEVISDVRDLAAQARESTVGARAETLNVALGGLGIAQANCSGIHTAVCQALLSLATRLRAAGSSDAASSALDALADVTDARLELLLPIALIPELLPVPDDTQTTNTDDGAFFRANPWTDTVGDSPRRWWPTISIRPDGFGTVFHEASEPLTQPLPQVLKRFANGERIGTHELADVLQPLTRAPRQETQPGPDEEELRRRRDSSEAYDLVEETAASLLTLLPSPFPDSAGWPGGWQGHGELDRDVRRIAGLAAASYLRGQYPPSSVVEESLEAIAGMIRREPMRLTDLPADRTGWRDPPTAVEEGGPASATAASLGALMELAFQAGFDRRALLTGRRIVAAATSSAKAGDMHGLLAYRNAIQVFTRDAILHGRTSRTQAGRRRQRILLAGVIAEIDQLLEHRENPRLRESIDDIVSYLTWRAQDNEIELRSQAWQAELAAAGWPVPLPGAIHSLSMSVEPDGPESLPGYLFAEAEHTVTYELGREDPIWAAGTVIALWAHAAATASSDAGEAKRVSALLAQKIREHDARYRAFPYRIPIPGKDRAPGTPQLHLQLRRLASTAIKWCKAADPAAPCVIPSARKETGAVDAAARLLLSQPDFTDWVYLGLRTTDDESLVIVEEPDGSRRLLRDTEACARGRFTWGYSGNGPHTLAEVLVPDMLDDYIHCSACLGGSPCGAGLISCPACGSSGQRTGSEWAAAVLVEKVISDLIQTEGWRLTRRSMLAQIAKESPALTGFQRFRQHF